MNIETYENIKRDLSSFADDELDMICDMQGNFMFERHGQVLKIKIKEDDEGRLLVQYNNLDIPYNELTDTYKHYQGYTHDELSNSKHESIGELEE